MRELRQSDGDAKQQSEGVSIIPALARPAVPVHVIPVPANGICNTGSLAAALPSREPSAEPHFSSSRGTHGATHPAPSSEALWSTSIPLTTAKVPGQQNAWRNPGFLPQPLTSHFPFSFAWKSLSSCTWAAKLPCHPELPHHRAIAKPTETKGEGGVRAQSRSPRQPFPKRWHRADGGWMWCQLTTRVDF